MNLKTTALAATLCLAFAPAVHAAGEAGGKMTQDTGGSAMGQSAGGGSSMGGSSAMNMNQDTVRQVQQELSEAGHNPGPIDGVMGEQTKSALKQYQQAQGMEATGTLDERTMDALGVEASAGGGMSGGMGGGASGGAGAGTTGGSMGGGAGTPGGSMGGGTPGGSMGGGTGTSPQR